MSKVISRKDLVDAINLAERLISRATFPVGDVDFDKFLSVFQQICLNPSVDSVHQTLQAKEVVEMVEAGLPVQILVGGSWIPATNRDVDVLQGVRSLSIAARRVVMKSYVDVPVIDSRIEPGVICLEGQSEMRILEVVREVTNSLAEGLSMRVTIKYEMDDTEVVRAYFNPEETIKIEMDPDVR